MSEGLFFQDLAVLMTVAGIVAAVFSRLGWPKVIGYILAGVALNSHTWGGSFLSSPSTTQTIGELGVVFLMFGMGLSFSPREMKSVRSVAIPAALLDTVVMTWLGYTVGTRVFGWPSVPSFFLGVAICDSATTLLAKVIDEKGWGSRAFAKYVLSTSVGEDIVCVGAIAVATGFATGGTMTAGAFVKSLAGLGVFFLSVLVFGFILVPRLLTSVAKRRDDEALVLMLLGCCFFISYNAYKFGCSLALGAFLMGVIGGSSDVRDRLGRLVDPLKSMFAAVFFVSIGLLVDPAMLLRHLPEILLVSTVVVVGKFVNIFVASLAAGADLKTSVQNGFGLAQIGEFAFMTAILYAGLVPDAQTTPLFPIAIGVSLLTTLLSPVLIRVSDPVGDWAERILPERLRKAHETYRTWIEKLRLQEGSKRLAHARGEVIRLSVYAVLTLSVSVVCSMLHRFDYSRFSVFFEHHDGWFFFVLSNLFPIVLLPLVYHAAKELGADVATVIVDRSGLKTALPIRQVLAFSVMVVVLVLFFFEWTMLNLANVPAHGWPLAAASAVHLLILVAGWRFFVKAGRRATTRFHEALTAEERRKGIAETMTLSVPQGVVHKLTLAEGSPAVGGTVVTLNIRAKTGASVVSVIRAGEIIRNVSPEWIFAAGDVLIVLGNETQVKALEKLVG